jgi:pyruvate dehydrogenase E2 component (dihydrolipoamide acetyltransferase)
MPIPVILPKFGFTLESAEIVQWLKHDGDTVRAGDPICEVTTDKVNMEVEAPEEGTLFGLRYQAGATVPVTEVICYLLRPGEARPVGIETQLSVPAATQPISPSIEEPTRLAATPVAQRIAEAAKVDLAGVRGTGPNNRITRRDVEKALQTSDNGKVRATPAARALVGGSGIDLNTISGSGPRGRIQATDVQALLTAQVAMEQAAPTVDVVHVFAAPSDGASAIMPADAPRKVKLEGMRRTIANRLQKSFQTAPHIFFDAQINTGGLETLRAKVKARGDKLSVTAILVKACAWALLKHPWLNATLDDDEIALWPTANIGVAVALEAGLVVPVVRHAERLSIREVQAEVDTLAERARSSALRIEDVVDGTFTVSNLGMFGVDRFTAIINPPQVAILAVGRTQQHFVPDENGQPVLRSFMNVTLSADHRVVDGAQAANFLQDLRAVLEEPALLAW